MIIIDLLLYLKPCIVGQQIYEHLKQQCLACGPDIMFIDQVGIVCRLCMLYPPSSASSSKLFFSKAAWSERSNEISKHFADEYSRKTGQLTIHRAAINTVNLQLRLKKRSELFAAADISLIPVGKAQVSDTLYHIS